MNLGHAQFEALFVVSKMRLRHDGPRLATGAGGRSAGSDESHAQTGQQHQDQHRSGQRGFASEMGGDGHRKRVHEQDDACQVDVDIENGGKQADGGERMGNASQLRFRAFRLTLGERPVAKMNASKTATPPLARLSMTKRAFAPSL